MELFVNQEALENFMNGLGFWGPFVFFLLQVTQVIIAPIPGNVLTMVGGALFGVWPGFFLAYAANIAGSILGFVLVRKFGRALLVKIMGVRRFEKYMGILGTDSAGARTKVLFILIVLLPFLPSDFMCLIVCLTPISFKAFILIVIICRPWGQLAAALLGAVSFNIPWGWLIVIIAVMIAVCVVAVRFAPKLEALFLRWARKAAARFGSRKDSEAA
jgi:uncharacterized membrane protein YdjX (TVP38/TMEM64 family)